VKSDKDQQARAQPRPRIRGVFIGLELMRWRDPTASGAATTANPQILDQPFFPFRPAGNPLA
jgi:hypothetical protein